MEIDPSKVKNDGICDGCKQPCPCHFNEYAQTCECKCDLLHCTCQRCSHNRGTTVIEDLINP